MSAVVTGLAGALLGFQTYLVSAEAVSVPFSGELLAMVVIGGMHQHPGAGARRAVLHPVPRAVLDLDRELAAVVRPGVRRLRAVLARRPRRHLGERCDAAGGRRRKRPPR